MHLVRKYEKLANYDPRVLDWRELTSHFPGRSVKQIYSHWKYATVKNERTPYLKAEDVLIHTCISECKLSALQVQQILGDKRTDRQIKYRNSKLENDPLFKGIAIGGNQTQAKREKLVQEKFASKIKKILNTYLNWEVIPEDALHKL